MEENKIPPLIPPNPVEIPELTDVLPRKQKKRYKGTQSIRKDSDEERRLDATLEMENNKGVYDIEKIKKWKVLGIQKPDWIPQSDWVAADKGLTPLQGVILHLGALAMKPTDIASITGASDDYVLTTMGNIAGKAEISRIQDKIWGDDFKKIIQKIVPLAIQTAVTAMLDPKTKAQTKVDAAFRFMDRAMGRPVQQIEVNDNLIRSVFEKLDSEANKVIDITQKKPDAHGLTNNDVTDTVKQDDDPVESWVKENL